jgi:hypothetical protein
VTFHCDGCGATHVFLNVTLLALVLRAIADGSDRVWLSGAASSSDVERPNSARVAAKDRPVSLPEAAARLHICTIWCSGGDHVERAAPDGRPSDDQLRAGFERLGLEVTLIEPMPDYMLLPGGEPGRLIWFKTRARPTAAEQSVWKAFGTPTLRKERTVGVEPVCRELQVAPSAYYAAKSRPPSARAVRDALLVQFLVALWSANYRVGPSPCQPDTCLSGLKLQTTVVDLVLDRWHVQVGADRLRS